MGRKRSPENARLGQYVQRRADGRLELRYPIPEDVQHAFPDANGKPRKQVIKQLKTSDVAMANAAADQLRVDIRQQIDRARSIGGRADLATHLRMIYRQAMGELEAKRELNEEIRRRSVLLGSKLDDKAP